MSNFELFCETVSQYISKHSFSTKYIDTIKNLSCNTSCGKNLCDSAVEAIDMDNIAKKCYRKIHFPLSETENDAISTADCFLINGKNQWYFIEFKDSEIKGNAVKRSVLKKAYSNVYEVLDIVYEMKDETSAYAFFDYTNPIRFIHQNVNYILVFSSEKNPKEVVQERNHKLKGEIYTPEYMKKLQGYIFNEVRAMSESSFQREFLAKFSFD